MKRSVRNQPLSRREAVTHFLDWLGDETRELDDVFVHWARRKPRLDDEHQLAKDREREYRAFRKQVEYLRRKKFLKTKKTEEGLLVELSNEGRVELMKRLVRERSTLKDEQVCLVVYDVPNEGNLGRDALRYFLKRIGFKQVQRSVWATNKDVVCEVLEFIKSSRITKWVEIYLAKKQG